MQAKNTSARRHCIWAGGGGKDGMKYVYYPRLTARNLESDGYTYDNKMTTKRKMLSTGQRPWTWRTFKSITLFHYFIYAQKPIKIIIRTT